MTSHTETKPLSPVPRSLRVMLRQMMENAPSTSAASVNLTTSVANRTGTFSHNTPSLRNINIIGIQNMRWNYHIKQGECNEQEHNKKEIRQRNRVDLLCPGDSDAGTDLLHGILSHFISGKLCVSVWNDTFQHEGRRIPVHTPAGGAIPDVYDSDFRYRQSS